MPLNAEHSGVKRMEQEVPTTQNPFGPPPVMPWASFVDWIGMSSEPEVAKAWLQRGYIPTLKIGKRLMVNVALYTKELLERESI